MVCWPSGVLEAWGTKANTPTRFLEESGLGALPPKAAMTKKRYFIVDVWFLALAPQASEKNTWPKKHFGIPVTWLHFGLVKKF